MNFFEAQHRARKKTALLVFLFGLAVVIMALVTNFVFWVAYLIRAGKLHEILGPGPEVVNWPVFGVIGIGVVAVISHGSWSKMSQLSAGGKIVAESLGAKLIAQNTRNLKQRRLLNVVAEMAVASGTPAPPVYVLTEERGINAFAAGFSPRDAVIGVTRGTIDHLDRDQLQGVIAHEFSHIFNGDMRLNIRLTGILHGILIIGQIGRCVAYGRRRKSRGDWRLWIPGWVLMAIGFAGSFFGGLIKAAVSRQREFLADAAAVQYTRNPDGIAGALKKIGGLGAGAKIKTPAAAEISHSLFAQGVSGILQSLFATHPSLSARIRRIDPGWGGKFFKIDISESRSGEKKGIERMYGARGGRVKKTATIVASATMEDFALAIDQIGNPRQDTIEHARNLIDALPVSVVNAAGESYGAPAVIYSLMLDSDRLIRERQFTHLTEHAEPDVVALTRTFMAEMAGLDITYRSTLIIMAVPGLKQLSVDQYRVFRKNLTALIETDAEVDMLEWVLRKILFSHLEEHFSGPMRRKSPTYRLDRYCKEVALILSALAHAGHQARVDIEEAFTAASEKLSNSEISLVEKNQISLAALDRALDRLTRLAPEDKPRLLKACAASVLNDQIILPVELKLLRAFSGVLDCPMPLVLPAKAAS
ncbi:MAG: M48 family metallopeptidase [Proteobacteria bacterium]|nr:M48 family metallopeptidase [Pseudomonadota bacterium]